MNDLGSLEDKLELGKKLFQQAQYRQALGIFLNILPASIHKMGPDNSAELINMISHCYYLLDDYVNFVIYSDQLLIINDAIEEIRWNNLSESERENERMKEALLVDDLSEFLVEDYIFEYTMSILLLRKIAIIKKIGYWGETLDTYNYLESI